MIVLAIDVFCLPEAAGEKSTVEIWTHPVIGRGLVSPLLIVAARVGTRPRGPKSPGFSRQTIETSLAVGGGPHPPPLGTPSHTLKTPY